MMMDELERRFNARMIEIYQLAKKLCNYNASRFLQLVSGPDGGVAAAKRLLSGDEIQYGLMELYHCGHLEISVEAAVVSEEYRSLFSADEITAAEKRLKELHYEPTT